MFFSYKGKVLRSYKLTSFMQLLLYESAKHVRNLRSEIPSPDVKGFKLPEGLSYRDCCCKTNIFNII